MQYANDPFWVRLRWVLFIAFWVIWVAMLVASIAIIVYTPKCPSPSSGGRRAPCTRPQSRTSPTRTTTVRVT